MIRTSQVHHCRDCGSAHIVRNGRNRCGSQQYLCRECGASRVPQAYRKCHSFSDFWKAYAAVLPEETHRSVGKESGETAHMERWNNTLRQRIGRFVRETLSFSKKNWWHDQVTHWFIVEYNLSCSW